MPDHDRDSLAPELQNEGKPELAPVLGGVRGYPPHVVDAVKWALVSAGLGPVAKRHGRHYDVVLMTLTAEFGLERPELEALIAWHFPDEPS